MPIKTENSAQYFGHGVRHFKNALICAICKTARNIKNNTAAGKRENEAYFNALSYVKQCIIKNTRAQTGT